LRFFWSVCANGKTNRGTEAVSFKSHLAHYERSEYARESAGRFRVGFEARLRFFWSVCANGKTNRGTEAVSFKSHLAHYERSEYARESAGRFLVERKDG